MNTQNNQLSKNLLNYQTAQQNNTNNKKSLLSRFKFPFKFNFVTDLDFEFLVKGCNIPNDKFDSNGNCKSGWRIGKYSGPPGYLKSYIPPIGWNGIGLKVINLYDNGNNTWIGTSNINGEWYIGYHGTKTMAYISGIVMNGFKRGDDQQCKNYANINPLNNLIYPKCGEGVYFTPDINEAKKYTNSISYSGQNYRVVFMCRINPYRVRIANYFNKEYWIVNGDKLNDYYASILGIKRTDEVRPYRILLLKEQIIRK